MDRTKKGWWGHDQNADKGSLPILCILSMQTYGNIECMFVQPVHWPVVSFYGTPEPRKETIYIWDHVLVDSVVYPDPFVPLRLMQEILHQLRLVVYPIIYKVL